MNSNKKYTSLFKKHLDNYAKMVDFAGFSMPVNYKNGIQYEYNAVRNEVGVFDVSHMGEIFISGKEAFFFLQYITINDISKLINGDAQYNAVCNVNGGIKDDIIIYCLKNEYILIVNASNYKKIFEWCLLNNTYNCTIKNESDQYSLIAVQGPKSKLFLSEILDVSIDLNFYKHKNLIYNNKKILLSRTGYTGELGYEILCDHDSVINLWESVMMKGVVPCGLAVRDILRLEMKYCLYGNDINEETSPIEAGLEWIINYTNDFIGSDYLISQKKNGVKRKLIAFKMNDRCIPRKGYEIFYNNDEIGLVTSGTFSLGLNRGIGMGYVKTEYSNVNTIINLKIRNKDNFGEIIKPPFIKEYSLHD